MFVRQFGDLIDWLESWPIDTPSTLSNCAAD
jgi:hypothetical protein